jgi:hypothetical protein
MSVIDTIEAMESYCTNNSGTINRWQGNNATYMWSIGRDAKDGITNGVVRKLAGTAADGKEIWAVAGSFKIQDTGEILRFTGLPKKVQAVIQAVTVTQTVAESV